MFPLFKACTRPPMKFGVPIRALIITVLIGLGVAFLVNIFLLILLPIVVFFMAQVTKKDDKQFNILGVYVKTKLLYPRRLVQKWNATSYSPHNSKISKLNKLK